MKKQKISFDPKEAENLGKSGKEWIGSEIRNMEGENIEIDVDEKECMWLSSSGCSSPSSFFDEYRAWFEDDRCLISWLSTFSYSHLNLDQVTKDPDKVAAHQDSSDSEYSRFSNFEDSSLVSLENSKLSQLHHRSSTSSSSEEVKEEPLFWPSEWGSNWSSMETWKCFSMSPRKEIVEPGEGSNGLDSKKINPQPSRFRDSVTAENRKFPFPEDLFRGDNGDDDDDITTIESKLGLGEFDGHEGVDSEFNQYVFSMDDDDEDCL